MSRDHKVLHLFSSGYLGPKGDTTTNVIDLEIKGIGSGVINRPNLFSRFFLEYQYGKSLIPEFDKFKPDVIISANSPLLAQREIIAWAQSKRVRFIYWLQDIHSLALKSILRKKLGFLSLVPGKFYESLERRLLTRADHVVAICKDFEDILLSWQVSEKKISVVPNWAPIESIPVRPQDNIFSRRFGFAGKFVVMYTGTLGYKHNPGMIAEAAKRMKNEDFLFVVVSEGAGLEYLKTEKNNCALDNLFLIPFQPFTILPEVLGTAGIFFVTLEQEAGIYSVPSKVWACFCAGRPTVVAVSHSNLAARITSANECGLVISPDSIDELINALRKLRRDKALSDRLGSNARVYAENNFNIHHITNKFESILRN